MTERPAIARPPSLAEVRLSAETLDSVVGHVSALAVEALEGWDAAAASVSTNGRVATFGSTDDRIDPVDQNQYDSGHGPCVDAMRGGDFQYYDGESVPPEWRLFAEAAANADVYSVISFPMKVDSATIGALNVYSSERHALRSGQREEGMLFAAQAAVVLSNASDYLEKAKQVEQLEEGLATRTLIGQATGLVMAQEGLTSDEAFQKLVQVSQLSNVKLRDIATRYVDGWNGGRSNQTR